MAVGAPQLTSRVDPTNPQRRLNSTYQGVNVIIWNIWDLEWDLEYMWLRAYVSASNASNHPKQ